MAKLRAGSGSVQRGAFRRATAVIEVPRFR